MTEEISILRRRLERERQARKEAERIAEEKSRELFIKNQELIKVAEAERKVREQVERLSVTDFLTGFYNRRYLNQTGKKLFMLSDRHNRPLSAIIADIDHFKTINDAYGHATGDNVLISFADVCRTMIRESDLASRYGGEEFCFLLPETDSGSACHVAERLKAGISNMEVREGSRTIRITASFGVSERFEDDDSVENILNRSDEALYEAKRSGRNRVVLWRRRVSDKGEII
ncbi:MAG: GGDEF domain-containing protein [Thermodesulfobacteriota bacterium]